MQRIQRALDDLPEVHLLAVFSAALEHRPALARVRDDVMAAMYTGLGGAVGAPVLDRSVLEHALGVRRRGG